MNEILETQTPETDWKAVIPTKFLYVNNDLKRRVKIEKKYGKSYADLNPLTDKIEDIDLICMLGGLKYLLKKRGYKSVKFLIKESNPEYASVNCVIVFKGSPEIKGEEDDIEYSENACAHLNNTTNFAKYYLVEMATNRAFARCIRSFLNINVVSKEELDENLTSLESEESTGASIAQVELLQKELDKRKITWEQFKIKLSKDKIEGIENMRSLSELPKDKIFEYLEKLKKKEKKEVAETTETTETKE